MGVAQAGVVFRLESAGQDFRGLMSHLFDQDVQEIPHPDAGKFDIRHASDVMVQVFGDVCFICNDSLVWDLLEKPQADARPLFSALGSPALMLVFCRYDSGGSYGYAVIERGEITRSRLQTSGIPGLAPLVEFGEPKAFETPWLSAPHFLEEDDGPREAWQKVYDLGGRKVSEHHLTARMLFDALESLFGVCPWETERVPVHHFFKLSPRKKPWWRRWTSP